MLSATLRRYRTAYSGLPREVWLLAIVLFVNRAGSMVIPFLTLYLTRKLGMSESAAAGMASVYGVGAIGGAYLSGRLCEAVGAIRLQTFCMFLAAPLYLLVGAWNDWRLVAASLLVLSLVAEGVRPANATALTKVTTPENRARAFGVQRLAVNLGFSVGPVVGGLLTRIDYKWLFIVDAATTLLAGAALAAFFGLRRLDGENGRIEQRLVRVSPLKDRKFLAFLGLSLATMIVFLQFATTYPLYLQDHFGMNEPQIGLMFAVNTSIIVAVEILLIDAVKGWPMMRTIGWGSCLACWGFGMLPFGTSASYAVLAMVVVTIGEMLSFSLAAAFVAGRSGPGSESLYLGWYVSVHSLAWVVGPALGGTIYERNPDALWYAGLVVGAGVLAGYELLARSAEQPVVEACEAPAAELVLATVAPVEASGP